MLPQVLWVLACCNTQLVAARACRGRALLPCCVEPLLPAMCCVLLLVRPAELCVYAPLLQIELEGVSHINGGHVMHSLDEALQQAAPVPVA